MTEENYTTFDKTPGSGYSSPRKEKPDSSPIRQQSSQSWDFDSYFPSDHPGRIRASSWDDSDDNLPPIPDNSGSKTCRIYTNDDKKPRPSVASEINELRRQFFNSQEKHEDREPLETLKDELEIRLNYDRRQSPARIRRRSNRSSGSCSPVVELETQVSPKKGKDTDSDTDFQDVSPKVLHYDPAFYLNNFFTELRTKRISLMDPVKESIITDIQNYDRDLSNDVTLEEKDVDLSKTSRKLSQILEVEETRKDLEKKSKENMPDDLLAKCIEQQEEIAIETCEKTPKTADEKFKSLSLEYCKNLPKPQKNSQGSLSERSAKFFNQKLDDDFISLSAKVAKTQLTSPKSSIDKSSNTPIQFLSVNTTDFGAEKSILESLKIDLVKDASPRKSTDRSEQSQRSRSGKSRKSYNSDSPKFKINIGGDSTRSLKVDDVSDSQTKDNTDEYSAGKYNSENGSEAKTERIPPITIESPSMDSVISTQRSPKEQEVTTNCLNNQHSSQRSQKKKRKQRSTPESKERSATEPTTPIDSPKTHKSSRRTSHRSAHNEFEKIATTSNSRRISNTPKEKTPKTTHTPSTNGNPEINLDITERLESRIASYRSPKIIDTARKDSDRSESKHRSQRQSSRNTASSLSRGIKMTPRTNSGGSRRSRDSLENREDIESVRMMSWMEFGKICDTPSNHSSVSSAVSSWREVDIPSQQHSCRSDIYNLQIGNYDNQKERLSRSRNSSKTSIYSNVSEPDNSSPVRSAVRLSTCKEYPSAIPQDDGRTHRNSLSEEDEEVDAEENPIHRSKFEDESDSNKRLSVINEVSFEDLETSNGSSENEEKHTWEEYRSCSRQDTRQMLPEKISTDESASINFSKTEGEQWNELIKEFNGAQNSFILENFPGFPRPKDISWNSNVSAENKMAEENSEESFLRNKIQKVTSFEKSESLNNLVYQDPLSDKTKQDEFMRSIQNSQNIYYVNVTDNGGSFGIGEFGDVTCWNAEKLKFSDDTTTKDSEKPKDHGDGIPMQITPEVRAKEKQRDVKSQLREDTRDSAPFFSKLEVQDDMDATHYIPCRLRSSKSDTCINKKITGGSDCQVSTDSISNAYKYKSEAADLLLFGTKRKTNKVKYTSKNTINQNSSSGSLASGKDWENLEFEFERTPRGSKSLSNLDIRLQECMYQKEASISGSELQRSSRSKKDSTDLLLLLMSKAEDDKMAVKQNWLELKHSGAKHSLKRNKKVKTKLKKKDAASTKQTHHDYLYSRKGRSSVSSLKLRNPNCFQNFYKRFISVFCVTSNSSAATSK